MIKKTQFGMFFFFGIMCVGFALGFLWRGEIIGASIVGLYAIASLWASTLFLRRI